MVNGAFLLMAPPVPVPAPLPTVMVMNSGDCNNCWEENAFINDAFVVGVGATVAAVAAVVAASFH